jgi:hypothetical protein
MKARCHQCGMIRSKKDLVKCEDSSYLCFSCWNQKQKESELTRNFQN